MKLGSSREPDAREFYKTTFLVAGAAIGVGANGVVLALYTVELRHVLAPFGASLLLILWLAVAITSREFAVCDECGDRLVVDEFPNGSTDCYRCIGKRGVEDGIYS